MVLMTWNLGRRTHADQARIIAAANPDVVALQEVSARCWASLTQALERTGLPHTHVGRATGSHTSFMMIVASKWRLEARALHGVDVPRPDRVQVVLIHAPGGDVEVVHVHVPAATSSGVATKVATCDGLARYLAEPTTRAHPMR